MEKSPDAFRTISEAAEELDVPQHVLRFWETRFNQLKPMKRGGGRRYYRPDDMELLRSIRHLLYGEGYTIRGVQRMLKQHGAKAVSQLRPGETLGPSVAPMVEGSATLPDVEMAAMDVAGADDAASADRTVA
jgi:DNA-binding transcriptional MerR regulator